MGLSDELSARTTSILKQTWNPRDGRVVPSTSGVALAGGAVKLDATVLYADMSESSRLATDFQQRTAAKIMRAFIYCVCRLVTTHKGSVTSFDGDRVMGVFVGELKNTQAAKCALKINHVMERIIRPKVNAHFESMKQSEFEISHCVGVDSSSILAVKAGQRDANDLIWIGRASNLAAKLSDVRESPYNSIVTADVFNVMNDSAKYSIAHHQLMWEERSYEFVGELFTVYVSNWMWQP